MPTGDPSTPTPEPPSTPEPPAGDANATADPTEPPDTGKVDWKALARKHEDRAKANHTENERLKAEVEELRRRQLSEQELAILAAQDEAATTVRREMAVERAGDWFTFEAARLGVAPDVIAADLEDRDLARYIGADGAPDRERIAAAAARLAPAKTALVPPDALGQGSRGGTEPTPLAEQIRAAEAAGNWRLSTSLKTQLLAAAAARQP